MKKNYWIFVIIIIVLALIAVLQFLSFGINIMVPIIYILFILVPCFIIYFVNRLGKKRNIELLDYREKVTDEYFREILYEYSPGSLCYIDNYNIDNNVIVATLLSLKMKGAITFNKQIDILNKDIINLSITEKYILDMIKCGKLELRNLNLFREKCFEEALEKNLILNEKSKRDFSMKNFLIISGVILVTFILQKYVNFDFDIFVRIMGFEFILILIYFCTLYQSIKNSMIRKRTTVGEEVNHKLEGLKIYLKDFSEMDKRDKEEVNLWNEYLVYSVMFNQNKKIVKEIEKFINIEFY